ncbi:MAG TPA: 50S ribosomal protein L13 [Gammaproteobacteria bacterium]|nr:50S ribosomal protein L13 [Gammaproteobacteria bacterium]
MKTYQATNENVKRNWCLIDASGRTLGRLATEVARRLRGKHKPEYTPHVDTGDFVVIINADKIKVTGDKAQDKKYYRYSGYQSGMKEATFEQLLDKHPTRVIEIAVKGMLPKNPLGRAMIRKLKVYAGPEHPHAAQMPQVVDAQQLDQITGEG